MYKSLDNRIKAGLSYSLLMCLYMVITFIGQSILKNFCDSKGFAFVSISALFSVISIFLIILFNKITLEKRFTKITRLNKFDIFFLPLSLMLSVGMLLGLGFVNEKFANLFINMGLNVKSTTIEVKSFYQFLIYTFTLAILPAFLEETFFRGFVSEILSEYSVISVSIFSGVIFGLYHCSISQLIYQIIYGFSLSILAIKSRSIFPAVLSHFINNFVIILFIYLDISIDFNNIFIIIIGLVCLAIFYALIILKNKGKKQNKNRNIINAYLFSIFGIILALVLIFLGLLIK